MNEDGTMAKGQNYQFWKAQLKIGKIEDLISYRLKEKLIRLKKTSDINVNQNLRLRFMKIY